MTARSAQAWTSGTTINHLYAADGLYRPTVTLKDAVGNTRVVALAAIVPGDTTAPVGTFTTSPAKAWQALTTVNLTQNSLSDDFSPASYILRWIDWGDGSAVLPVGRLGERHPRRTPPPGPTRRAWCSRTTPGTPARWPPGPSRCQADLVAPVVKITKPKKGVADEVSSWKKLAGVATDDQGTGVVSVAVLAIEKRTSGWYFFKASSKTWLQAATKAKAWKRAKAAVVTPTAKGAWVVRLSGLKKGTLIAKATATDLAGNVSAPVPVRAVLTAT